MNKGTGYAIASLVGLVILGGLILRYGNSAKAILQSLGGTAVHETQALTLAGPAGNPGYYGP